MGERVLVFGGRDFHDEPAMLTALCDELGPDDIVIHGGARGADSLAGDVAGRLLGHEVWVFPADWHRYGKGAGPKRNQQMLDEGKPHRAVMLPGGRGTEDMRVRCEKAGVPVAIKNERGEARDAAE